MVSDSPSDCSLSQEGMLKGLPLVTFYDFLGRKKEVLFFYSVPDTTRDYDYVYNMYNVVEK
jgi:hypothetical protein